MSNVKKSNRDKVINVYVTEEMMQKFKAKAESLGLTVSSFLMVAAADYIKQDEALKAMKQINMFDLMRNKENQ